MFGRSNADMTGDHPFTNSPLLLVSGMGRSGTTVIRNCVANHPEINCLNQESNYIFHLMRGANLHLESSFDRKNLVIDETQFWSMHRQFILKMLWPQPTEQAPPRAISTYSKLDPRAAIGLAETFSKLSICYVVRNGIEVVSSYRAFANFKHLSFEEVCRTWAFHSLITQYVIDQPHCTLVRFEWLQEDLPRFVTALGRSFEQVGLKFNDACRLPLAEQYHPTRYAGESSKDSRNLAKRRDRWQRWSDHERELFSELCGPTMQSLNYAIPWQTT